MKKIPAGQGRIPGGSQAYKDFRYLCVMKQTNESLTLNTSTMYIITIVESIDTYDSHSVKNIKSNATGLQSAMADAETVASNIVNSGQLPCTKEDVYYFDLPEWDRPCEPTDNSIMVINFGYDEEERAGCVIVSVGEV